MGTIFISHSEKDKEIMEDIARGLEQAGYSTWYFERDVFPGTSYLQQITRAIEECDAVVLIASSRSVASDQTTSEVVGAFERGIPFFPVLVDLTPPELKDRQPEWRHALGATAMIMVGPEGVVPVVDRIVEGLRARGVRPPSEVQKTKPEAEEAVRPAAKMKPRKKFWIVAGSVGVLALIALVLILLFVVFEVGSSDDTTAPGNTKEYKNADAGFSFEYPASWKQLDENNLDQIQGIEDPGSLLLTYNEVVLVDELSAYWEHVLGVGLIPRSVSGGSWEAFKESVRESEQMAVAIYREQGIDVPDPQFEDTEVDGKEALSASAIFDVQGTQFNDRTIYVNGEDRFYVFAHRGRRIGEVPDENDFDAILESVRFEE